MSDLSLRQRFAAWLMGISHEQFAKVTAKPIKDDGREGNNDGFMSIAQQSIYDRPPGEAQQFYLDALDAWRESPQAKRAVDVVTDYVLGDGIEISSPVASLAKFINEFMGHKKNRQYLVELDRVVDELTRAGDLFPVLFRNAADGMSYIRFVPREQITQIVTAENDPDEELEFVGKITEVGKEAERWIGIDNKEAAAKSDVVMIHYSINRPIGAQFGESDLSTVLKWMQRYGQTLQGRVKMHWAARMFYWIVKVSGNIQEAVARYANPPAEGSIIVTDKNEEWEAVTPNLQGSDAAHDLESLRHIIYAGLGFPAIWMGESGTSNLAEAREARGPAERHLQRRQNYVVWMLQDIIFHAYSRAAEKNSARWKKLDTDDYKVLFAVQVTEVSREDNDALAGAGQKFAAAVKDLVEALPGNQPKLVKWLLLLFFKFIGEPKDDKELDELVAELGTAAAENEADEDDAAENGEESDNVESNEEPEDGENAASTE